MVERADWSNVPLSEIAVEVRGHIAPAAGQSYELWSVPSYATGKPEIVDGSEIGSAKLRVQPWDVLVCKINPRINRVWVVGEGSLGLQQIASPEWLVLRFPEEGRPIIARFMANYLSAPEFRRWIAGAVSGVTGSHTRAKSRDILRQNVPFPSMAEQQKIVAVLDDHIRRIEEQKSSLRSALGRASSMQDQIIPTWVIGFSRVGGKGLSLADVDDGILPELLPGWEWRRLGEVAEVVGGVTKDGKKQNDPSFVEVPYLRVANVQRGLLDLDNVAMIRIPERKAAQLRLQSGDILLNEGGDRDKLGRGWVWEAQIDNCVHQNHVFRARVHDQIVHPKIIAWHANGFGKAWCERNGRQTTNLASISLRRIKQLPVPVPPADLDQQAIVQEVERRTETIRRAMNGIESALSQGDLLKARLLRLAFSGKLIK